MQPLTASSSHRASSQAPSSVPYATPQSTFPQFSVPSAILPQNMTRAQIHAGVIKNTVRVIRIKLEIAALNRKLTDWTATQSSSQFRRVSEATGVRLNSIHGSNKTMLQQAESRLRHAEDDLQLFTTQLNSSSMAEAAARDYDKVQTQVIAYTTELTEWIRSFTAFDAHANRPAAPPPAPRRPSDSYAMDVDTPPLPEGPVANLQRRIAAMEETLEETKLGFDPSDIVDTERTSRLIEEAIAAVRSEQGKGKEKENMDPIDDAELRAAVDQSKKQFDQLAEQAVVLLKRNRHLKETVGLLTAEREKHRQLKAKT
ncbi:hypothetical protein C8J57DRAFT_13712 [Mycena rebaudengoi]|nr:hypothetical protein C8J57DRAFT_13712 [Mycena rebaudengoi]